MIAIQNETLGAMRRCALVAFVLCLSCVAANATQRNTHKLNANPGTPCCLITSINTTSGVVSATDKSTGQSFRFFVKDSAQLSSLKEGQAIFADFKTQQVFTNTGANGQSVRLGGILGGAYGNTPAGGTNIGPVDGAHPVGPIDGARPVGPIDGARPAGPVDGARPLGPVDGARPVGPIDGARPVGPIDGAHPVGPVDGLRPIGPVDGAHPAGPVDGLRPAGPVDGAHPAGPVDGIRPAGPVDGVRPFGPVDGAKPLGPVDGVKPLGPVDGAKPIELCCQITSIDTSSGLVTARDNQTGRSFRFRFSNANLLGSLKPGQAVSADFARHTVSLTLNGQLITGGIINGGVATHK